MVTIKEFVIGTVDRAEARRFHFCPTNNCPSNVQLKQDNPYSFKIEQI